MEKFGAGEMLRKKEAAKVYKKAAENDSFKNELDEADKNEEFIPVEGLKKEKVSLNELKNIHKKFAEKNPSDRAM